MKQIIILG